MRTPVAGRARTTTAAGGPAQHIAAAAIEAADNGDVLVIANDGRVDVSCWGGILTLAAGRRGIGGVVIDGACRDIGESEELGFPVFGRAVVPISARGRIVQLSMEEPVDVAGTRVHPGDLVLADRVRGHRPEQLVRAISRIAATLAPPRRRSSSARCAGTISCCTLSTSGLVEQPVAALLVKQRTADLSGRRFDPDPPRHHCSSTAMPRVSATGCSIRGNGLAGPVPVEYGQRAVWLDLDVAFPAPTGHRRSAASRLLACNEKTTIAVLLRELDGRRRRLPHQSRRRGC